ncbi:hypothetical protein [Neobacillus cucumis]|uniref:hypothetical protein n=1 Tax=Neobacillus cucumis TaxID=1740721 RepID=UPI0019656BB1|nr:hypothetical protein [Neobacillus cucumis]MBM7656033.1 hypothetical protein [Neobacillus cucumis]
MELRTPLEFSQLDLSELPYIRTGLGFFQSSPLNCVKVSTMIINYLEQLSVVNYNLLRTASYDFWLELSEFGLTSDSSM